MKSVYIFQDVDGKIIGQSTSRKIDELVEGSRLFVGNKEVEVNYYFDSCCSRQLYITLWGYYWLASEVTRAG